MNEYRFNLMDGDEGIFQTAKTMLMLAYRDARTELAKNAVAKLKAPTKYETLKNIYRYVWKNYDYLPDPVEYELVTAPIHLLSGKVKGEDCDGLVTLLVALLDAAGFETAVKVIAWRTNDFTHVIAEVKYKNYWIPLDPTLKADGFGFQTHKVIREKRFTKKDAFKNFLNDERPTLLEPKNVSFTIPDNNNSPSEASSPQNCDCNDNVNCNKNVNCIKAGAKADADGSSQNEMHNGNTININFGSIAHTDDRDTTTDSYNSPSTTTNTTTDSYKNADSFKPTQTNHYPAPETPIINQGGGIVTPNTNNENKNNGGTKLIGGMAAVSPKTKELQPIKKAKFYKEFP